MCGDLIGLEGNKGGPDGLMGLLCSLAAAEGVGFLRKVVRAICCVDEFPRLRHGLIGKPE